MSKPKICKKCGTKLSSYNPGPYCFAHTEGMPVKTHYPVSTCWSRKEPADRDRRPYSDGWYFDLNKEAFTRPVTGVVIDGKVESIESFFGLE